MQTSAPLLIRRQAWKSRSKIIADKLIGLFERIYSQTALHQSYSDDFRICESRLRIRRTAPMSQLSVGFEEVRSSR
jgi:hypothetical protein